MAGKRHSMDLRKLRNETYGYSIKGFDIWFCGIGGFLAIPFMFLCAVTGLHWLRLIGDILPIITENQWEILATPGSEYFHPSWRPKLIFDVVTVFSAISYGTFAIWAYLRNKSYTPIVMIIWFILITTIFGVDYLYILYHMFELFDYEIPEMVHGEYRYAFMQWIFWSLIWIPYFIFSKRVKFTFVK